MINNADIIVMEIIFLIFSDYSIILYIRDEIEVCTYLCKSPLNLACANFELII